MVFGDRSCLTSSFPTAFPTWDSRSQHSRRLCFTWLLPANACLHLTFTPSRAAASRQLQRMASARPVYGALGPRGGRGRKETIAGLSSSSAPSPSVLPSHHNCLGLTEIPPVSHKTWWIALSPVESTRICICGPRQHVCASLAVPGTLETGHLMEDAAIRNIVQ